MGVYTVNSPVVNPSAGPSIATAAASDTFPVNPTGLYVMTVRNTTGTADNVTITDPTSVSPAGAFAFTPNVVVNVPITTGERDILIDARRFRDANGNVNVAHSQSGAGVTVKVLGPF
jgi:hypothetical protein